MNFGAEGIHVVHVDDDEEFLELSSSMLEREIDGVSVTSVTHPDRAIELVADRDIDCIVADYEMPDRDGIELLEAVREVQPHLPVILFTARGSESLASEAIAAGVTGYLPKEANPNQFALLANHIETAVESARYRAQNRRLRSALETAREGISLLNEDGEYLFVNEAYANLYGYEPNEMVGEHWSLVYEDGDIPQIENEIIPTVHDEGYWRGHTTGLRADGSTFVEDQTLATAEGGELICTVRDISESVKYERAIADLHEVATALTTCDSREEVFDRTLEAAGSLLELDRSVIAIEEEGKLKVKAMSEAMDLEDAPVMDVDEGIAGQTYQRQESFLLENANVSDEARPQVDAGAALSVPIGDFGVFQAIHDEVDVFDEDDLELAELLVRHTEQALTILERERELEREVERLDEFTSVVSHDLRNPLNVAEGHLELAQEECESGHLDRVADAHDRMGELIDNLLDLARAGQAIAEPKPMELDDLVHRCWQTVSSGSATLQADLTRTINADESRLRQLLENLFRNAVEHGGPDVTIEVGEVPTGFYVADDGPGIPNEDRTRIFEAGYSSDEEGTGFGLSIVHAIATAHDWDVAVTESDAGGARFEFTGVEPADS